MIRFQNPSLEISHSPLEAAEPQPLQELVLAAWPNTCACAKHHWITLGF